MIDPGLYVFDPPDPPDVGHNENDRIWVFWTREDETDDFVIPGETITVISYNRSAADATCLVHEHVMMTHCGRINFQRNWRRIDV